jgi:hypothetical protein
MGKFTISINQDSLSPYLTHLSSLSFYFFFFLLYSSFFLLFFLPERPTESQEGEREKSGRRESEEERENMRLRGRQRDEIERSKRGS